MTIEQLPTFTIHRVESDRAIGLFDTALWIGERHLGDLLLPDERFVRGRFANVDFKAMTAAFVPTAADQLASLAIGVTYHRFDGYWGKRAALVLDGRRSWRERTFEPVDAVRFKRPDGLLVGKSTNQDMPEGGTVIKGGWDHEHCDICWETISPRTDPVAMFSEPHHWICRNCYEQFVLRRSLDFIVVEESG